MKRKAVKLILFIFGAAASVFWNVLFIMNMTGWAFETQSIWQLSMLEIIIILVIGLVPMSIAMLMHAKDIMQRKKGFAIFLIVLSIVWLAHTALMITVVIVVSLIFGWDTYSSMISFLS